MIIELYPEISPNTVERFKTLIKNKAYDDVAFHRVIKNKLVQAGDLEFGRKGNLDYGKIGTGKSGLGTIKSEIDNPFDRDGTVDVPVEASGVQPRAREARGRFRTPLSWHRGPAA